MRLFGGQVWIPCKPGVPIQVGHGERMAEPIFVETDIDHGDEAADGPTKRFSGDEVLHSCRDAVRVQVKIQDFFPHWN